MTAGMTASATMFVPAGPTAAASAAAEDAGVGLTEPLREEVTPAAMVDDSAVPFATAGEPLPEQVPGLGAVDGGVMPELLFADDFESGQPQTQPAAWGNFISWLADGTNPNADVEALLTTEQVHGGQQAVHFHGGANPAQLTRVLPAGTTKLYVRSYVRLSRRLGGNPGANHETLIALRGQPGAADREVRFGEIKGVIGTNSVPSDNIAPRMERWGQGPVVPADTWVCLEVAFLAHEVPHTLRAWVDGEEVHAITDPAHDFQNGPLPDNWLEGYFGELVIGWHSFSGATVDVWFDDLAVAHEPIGCIQ